jgi:nicotinate dehydrogenase subunit A
MTVAGNGLALHVNGDLVHVEVDPLTPLLLVLRNDLDLKAAKLGCGLEQCRACTIMVDGEAVTSCTTPVELVVGRQIVTAEGLGTPEHLHPVQQAFVDEQATQCGYCIPAMTVTAAALLEQRPRPTEAEIREALSGHLCRCGSHPRILRAIRRASAS